MVNDQNLLHDAAVTTEIHEGTTNNFRNITKISIKQKYNKRQQNEVKEHTQRKLDI